MNRTHALVVAVALLAVGALAVAAATVDAPRSGDPGYGTGTGSGTGDGTADRSAAPERQNEGVAIPPTLALLGTVVLAVVAVVGIGYLLLSLELDDLLRVAAGGVAVALVALLIFGLLIASPPADLSTSQQPQGVQTPGGGGDRSGAQQQQTPDSNDDVPLVLVGLFGLCALGLSLTIVRFSGSEPAVAAVPERGGEGRTDDDSVEAVGAAAGRAADDLGGDADLENAVYRAWEEMTGALEATRTPTTTPAEFADAAVEAGMDREDVAELTELFEAVRYGERPVTDERERRAAAALRRIEDAYAGTDDE